MKKILMLVLLFAGMQIAAKAGEEKRKGNGNVVKQERKLDAFDKIATGGSIDLVISQDGQESVTVETDENLQDVIITEVDGHTLSIRVKKHVRVHPTRLTVHINCKSLESIASGGSGDVKTTKPIKTTQLEVSNGGTGDFKLEVDVRKLEISTAGSGDYKLSGRAEDFELSMAGSGDVDARELDCGHARISAAGSGDIKLKEGTAAKVSIVGSGDVTYH